MGETVTVWGLCRLMLCSYNCLSANVAWTRYEGQSKVEGTLHSPSSASCGLLAVEASG